MTKTDADVIIAGAGPAGSIAAWRLAKQGVSVLVLEKADFPRYKVCGAGLTHKILDQIPFDVTPVIENEVTRVVFSSRFRDVFERSSDSPLIYCTMRDRLDGFLMDRAIDAGARVRYGVKVTGLSRSGDKTEVLSRDERFSTRLVIGADGASGMVARLAGLRSGIKPGLAWEAEVRPDAGSLEEFSSTVFLDWGTFPGGYGWVFPKADHFSIGVGGPAVLSGKMMAYYQGFIRYLQDQHRVVVEETMSMKSWPIPVRVKKSTFHNGPVLVTGDAAGLTDPLTGEGIYYAIRSGHLAAEACLACLDGSDPSLSRYTAAVNEELMAELLEANRIKYLFNAAPGRIHRFVRDNPRGWRAFGKVLRGERSYADVPSGFGKWRFLWRATCGIARLISKSKWIKRF